jgi:major type 1 subunit fimbrin (pilin)
MATYLECQQTLGNILMKQLILASLIIAATSTTVYATDGQITFTGQVTDNSCVVDTSAGGFNVMLQTVSATYLNSASNEGSPTNFSIKLMDCPDTVSAVKVAFHGNFDANKNLIPTITTGAAGNVGIKLHDYVSQLGNDEQ